MDSEELKLRTKNLAIKIVEFSQQIPNTYAGNVVAKQLIRSGTSVGANYRSACRAKSTADFISKLCIVEEEADETGYWLELIHDAMLVKSHELDYLLREVNEIVAIIVTSIKTTRSKIKSP